MPGILAGAIDLGGTKILSLVADDGGAIKGRDQRPTQAERGLDRVLGSMVESLRRACEDAGVGLDALHGIGVAVPGPIDLEAGVLASPPNLPGWNDVPLVRLLQERTRIPVLLENDANAAAVGEHAFGAGRGIRDMVFITISTGIGGGIIAGGRIYRGATGAAGEIGHMVVEPDGARCGCGRRGCLEGLASGTAIGRNGEHAARQGRSSALGEVLDKIGSVTAEDVSLAAQRGDTGAKEVLATAAKYLGIGLVTVVHLLNPQMIVIGGGASKIGDPLLGPAEAYMRSHAFPLLAAAVRIVPASTGDDAGALGAAALVLNRDLAESA